MLVISILTLLIASISAFLSLNTQEEIVKVSSGFMSALLFFLTLIVAPWPLKLGLISIPLLWTRLSNWSTQKGIN
ncbi:hypothetical protein PCC7424_2377 [Gloeothece citriformis PCC 7424]|uniref:Uncharacterized protein n=1 Tax=Gloeothece citriformis (strain PCC 7424) TaxID=65393 RepID=B7KIW2_GLOC7|nr:hypothetical protein [Gloeothece citriformis]ACK70798.1 hypothetical protein PCC7424_2377 [Gloeothece citriformis PCC 7424]